MTNKPASAAKTSAAQTSATKPSAGIVVVDKPAGWTSHDVVGKLRRIFHTKKVGHSGTLDPMATGVLVVGIDRGTRFLPHVHADTKAYTTTISLSTATHTDDAEGEVIFTAAPDTLRGITADHIRQAVAALTGDIMQRPAAVSAVKIDGVRAHERVRRGEKVDLPARPVTVSEFNISEIRFDCTDGFGNPAIEIDAAISCTAGTFVRALARDLGEDLGVGGHLIALRRTRAGVFDLSSSRTIEQLEAEPTLSMSLDTACVTCFPTREITEAEGKDLSQGKWLSPVGLKGIHAAVEPGGRVPALIEEAGTRAKTVFVVHPSTL